MSVMVLNDKHINTLVTYGVLHDIKYYFGGTWNDVRGNEDYVVGFLSRINETAFDVYYKNNEMSLLQPKFKHVKDVESMDSVQIIKAVECYEYQCDGWGKWEECIAKKLMDAIRADATRKLSGYDEAQWAIA